MIGRRVQRTERADEDLIGIWLRIAADDPAAADRFLDRFQEKFDLLAGSPNLGPARDDIAPGLRYLPVSRYLILYRILGDGIEIVRVVHASRHLLKALE